MRSCVRLPVTCVCRCAVVCAATCNMSLPLCAAVRSAVRIDNMCAPSAHPAISSFGVTGYFIILYPRDT